MTSNPMISIVSPVYKAKEIVPELVKRIKEAVEPVTHQFEIILVDDRCPDNSWQAIVSEGMKDNRVKGIRLSRNFGQHNAIAAGFEHAKGEFVVLMDCDLQHDPEYIPALLAKQKETGADIVFARLIQREHSAWKNVTSKGYFRFLKTISHYDIDPNLSNYSLLTRKVVNAYHQYRDYHKTYMWAIQWAGFDRAIVDVEHRGRYAGKSAYNFRKLITLALNTATTNSNKLLHITFQVGVATSLLALLGIVYFIYQYYTKGSMEGWTSLMVVIMFFSGLIITAIGICAIYISNVFDQTKNRPRYLISDTINDEVL
jgi:dolichol-phosphate mannosyltransferase